MGPANGPLGNARRTDRSEFPETSAAESDFASFEGPKPDLDKDPKKTKESVDKEKSARDARAEKDAKAARSDKPPRSDYIFPKAMGERKGWGASAPLLKKSAVTKKDKGSTSSASVIVKKPSIKLPSKTDKKKVII